MRKILLIGAALTLAGCNGAIDGATFSEGPDGLRCLATVLAIADTGETINEDPVAQLTLRVTPPHAAASFVATIDATVPRPSLPRRGDSVPVVCDPANPENTQLID